MAQLVEKRVQISEHRAMWLEQLARARGVTESALIDEGIGLLIQKESSADTGSDSCHEALQDEWEQLRHWEAEFGPLDTGGAARRIDRDEIVSVVGTPVDALRVRRKGELP